MNLQELKNLSEKYATEKENEKKIKTPVAIILEFIEGKFYITEEQKEAFLKEEKEVIENAFDEGCEERYQQDINSENPFYLNGLDYCKKTFKNK